MNLPLWIDNRAAEFRYALRAIRKTPGVSAVAIISLALGIGANTAIFSVVDAVLLKTLPVASPQELYIIARNPARRNTGWNHPDFRACSERNTTFTGIAGFSGGGMPLGFQVAGAGAGATTELVYGVIVSGNYFDVLGVKPAAGRVLNPDDDRKPGASPYAVLSYEFWQRRFNRDPGVIGRVVRLNGYPFTIVGVSRRGFRGVDIAASPDLFVPMLMRSEITGTPFPRWNNRNHFWFLAIGRLKPGANLKQAEGELTNILKDQEADNRKTAVDQRFVNPAEQAVLLPAARGYSFVRNRLEKPLIVLMAVVGVVLLIACANVANVMLARGAARQREIAVRLAVGATRARLGAQLLSESVLLALAGGAVGLVFAHFGTRALLEFLPQPGWTQVTVNVSADMRLFAFAFVVSLATGVLFGVAPALQSTRPDLVETLKEGARAAGSSRVLLRKGLVVVQVALSVLLVVGAGLFVRTLANLRDVEMGFRPEQTVVVFVDPSRNGYKGQRLRDFYERMRAGAAAIPGVNSVSLANITPLSGSRWNGDISIEGYAWKQGDKKYYDMNAVGPRYFETFGIPILLGRDFRDEDNPPFSPDPPETFTPGVRRPEPPGPRVAIVTESFAKRFFAGRSAIGGRFCTDEKFDPAQAYEIIGVVKDAHYFGLREAVEPMIYFSNWRRDPGSRSLCIRTALPASQVVETVRRQVTALDPAVPVLSSRTIEQQIDNNILEARLIATLSSFFGSLALLLAAVGLYGVIAYGVTRRTREIGIRMALGARRGAVLRLVLSDAALLVIGGAAVGIGGALALTRLVESFLFGIRPHDPAAIVAGTLVLAGVAALAVLIPARRAVRVDPMVALRHE